MLQVANSRNKQKFSLELRNRFSALSDIDEDVDSQWTAFKTIYNETAKNILGPKKKSNQEWISANSWKLVDERKTLNDSHFRSFSNESSSFTHPKFCAFSEQPGG